MMNNLEIDDTIFNWFLRAFFKNESDHTIFIYDKSVEGLLGLEKLDSQNYIPLLRNSNFYDGKSLAKIETIIHNYLKNSNFIINVPIVNKKDRFNLLKLQSDSEDDNWICQIDINNFGVQTVKHIGILFGWKAGLEFEKKLYHFVYNRILNFLSSNNIRRIQIIW